MFRYLKLYCQYFRGQRRIMMEIRKFSNNECEITVSNLMWYRLNRTYREFFALNECIRKENSKISKLNIYLRNLGGKDKGSSNSIEGKKSKEPKLIK